jgi:hypothetical protein
MNISELTAVMHNWAGVQIIEDFDEVYQGIVGRAECYVGLRIEYWEEMYYLAMVVTLRKPAGSTTRVIKWPYSRMSAHDIQDVIDDFETLWEIPASVRQQDTRGWFGRMIDSVTGVTHLGEYKIASRLTNQATNVDVRLVQVNQQTQVWFSEYRQAGVVTIAQIPHEACPVIGKVLAQYRHEAR